MRGITLTGADERTRIEDLIRLADLGAEIGILYTCSPDGRNRYPGIGWLREALSVLKGSSALHVCGTRGRGDIWNGTLDEMIGMTGRVQVNGTMKSSELETICNAYRTKTIITQHNAANEHLLIVDSPNHAILVDGSGGRGIKPELWPTLITGKRVGYAGGLGPANLDVELPRIARVGGEDWWVDMEGKLRNKDDWFSVVRAEEVMRLWNLWKAGA